MNGDLDYSKIRNDKTPLSDAEWKYIYHDGLVVTAYIQEQIELEHNNITNHSTDWTIREVNYALGEKKRIVFVSLDNTPLPRWFKFMFPNQQEVDVADPENLNQLCRHLCSWLNIPTKEKN